MTRFATKSLVMTAALAALAVGASAQSMKAEIPFTFRAGGAVLPAGSYRISVDNDGRSAIRVANLHSKKAVMVAPRYRQDAPKASVAGHPKLWFACAGSSCVLTTVWNGVDNTALVVGSPASGKEMAEIRVVDLTVIKTE